MNYLKELSGPIPTIRKFKYNLGQILTITQMEYKRGVRLLRETAKARGEAALSLKWIPENIQ